MSDETPVPETLETIAGKITALSKSLDARFDHVDKRFEQVDKRFDQVDKRFEQVDKRFEQVDKRFGQVDKRFGQVDKRFEQVDKRFEQVDRHFDELKAQLRVEIEAVNVNVRRVAEGFGAQTVRATANDADHEAFTRRLEEHDLRILAIEQRKRPRG